MDLAGKRVLVVGLGVSGYAAARVLNELHAKVLVTDSSAAPAVLERADRLRREGIDVEIGGHSVEHLHGDLAVISPGIAPSAPVVGAITDAGIETMSEVELAFRLAPHIPVLAVTGTNGKTTTATLLASMLVEGGTPAMAAGNIGTPLIEAIFDVADGGALVAEVSSFQLDAVDRFRPRVGVFLNVAEDHMDWHGSFEHYVAAKARLFENQSEADVLVYNDDDEAVARASQGARSRRIPFSSSRLVEGGIGVDDGKVWWDGAVLMSVYDIPLPGMAGVEDVLAASGAALAFGVRPSAVVRAVKSFRPLPHRMEVVAEAGEVTYIDDSKATNPHATLASVTGLRDVVLICGGRSKGIDLAPLAGVVPPVTAVVALGEARAEIAAIFQGLVAVDLVDDMGEAVRVARDRAQPGGSVLLAPACASLDMYESYAQRGEAFARAVRALLDEG